VNDSKGFSILEVVVSGAILMIVLWGVNLQFLEQLKSQKGIQSQTQAQLVMNQVIQDAIAHPERIPPIQEGRSPTADPMSYVGCWSEGGVQDGTLQVVGLRGKLAEPAHNLQGALLCPASPSRIEIHLTWVQSKMGNFQLQIDAIAFGAKKNSHLVSTIQL
jgi:hypothetical protein